jgi:Uma2 family endonuclease
MTPTIPPSQTPLMTAEEFVQLHGGDSDVELVDGVVVRLPMPGGEHGEVCGNAYAIVREWVKPNGLGRVMSNDTFVRTKKFPGSYRGADVCYLSYSRLPKDQPIPKGPLESPPELVIEVRSPTDRPGEIEQKVEEYLTVGVTVVTVLDPNIEAATVYRQ